MPPKYIILVILDGESRWFHEYHVIKALYSDVDEALREQLLKCKQNVRNIEWGRNERPDYYENGRWAGEKTQHPLLSEVMDVEQWNLKAPWKKLYEKRRKMGSSDWDTLRDFTEEHHCVIVII